MHKKKPFPVEFCDDCGQPVSVVWFDENDPGMLTTDAIPHICWYGVTLCLVCNSRRGYFSISNRLDDANKTQWTSTQ
jgi:hypothetical protein